MISDAAHHASNVVGLVFVAAFAPEEGEVLGQVTPTSKDSILMHGSRAARIPDGGAAPAIEFVVDPAKFHDAFAADLPPDQAAVMAATQRPVADAAFSDPATAPAWKDRPSWAVVATGDKAAGADLTRSMARARRRHDHRGRGLARGHGLPARGRDRGDRPGGRGGRRPSRGG